MKKIVKDGDVILDGTAPRYLKEKWAFEQLELLYDFIDIIRPVISIDDKSYLHDEKGDLPCAIVAARHGRQLFVFRQTFDRKMVNKLKKIKEMLEQ